MKLKGEIIHKRPILEVKELNQKMYGPYMESHSKKYIHVSQYELDLKIMVNIVMDVCFQSEHVR